MRCSEAVDKLGEDFDIVVNIQGDEPLMEPSVIDDVVSALQASPEVGFRCARPVMPALCIVIGACGARGDQKLLGGRRGRKWGMPWSVTEPTWFTHNHGKQANDQGKRKGHVRVCESAGSLPPSHSAVVLQYPSSNVYALKHKMYSEYSPWAEWRWPILFQHWHAHALAAEY